MKPKMTQGRFNKNVPYKGEQLKVMDPGPLYTLGADQGTEVQTGSKYGKSGCPNNCSLQSWGGISQACVLNKCSVF